MTQMKPEEMNRMKKQFFNDGAETWMDAFYKNPETGRYDLHRENFDRLFKLIPLKTGDRVLDAGCGSGVLAPWILERISSSGILYELDFAEKMIEKNRKLHEAENVRFIVADVAEAPLEDESCDVVFCFSCFPHFDDKEAALRNLSRILKRGGILTASHFDSSEEINARHKTCPAVMHDHLPGESEMRELFRKADLRIDRFVDEPGFYCIVSRK